MPLALKAAFSLAAMAGGLVILAGAEPPSRLPEDKKPAEKAAAPGLEGAYTIVAGEKDGKPVPEEKLKGSVVRFTADKIVGTDRDKKEFFTATYVLDSKKEPWVIRMKSAGPKEAEAVGLLKRDGDTLTIVYALPGADSPKEFKTKDRQHLFVMKRLKADQPKP